MRIGLDSFSFQIALAAGSFDLFRTLDRMEEWGVSGMQININGPNGRFLGGDPSDSAHVHRVRDAFERKGFFVEVAGHDTRPDRLEGQLRLCAELEAEVFRTLLVYRNSLDETFDQTRRDLEISLPMARQRGVRIALENHEDVTAAELQALVAEINDPHLGVCLDTGNDLVLYGDPLCGAQLLAPYAFTTHVKDHRLVRVAAEIYSVGVPLGSGDVDLPAVLGVIVEESPLDRVLIQDTWGYASRLNPFQRRDIVAPSSYDHLPEYSTEAEAREEGLLLRFDDLSPSQLRTYATQKEKALGEGIAYVRAILDRRTAGGGGQALT